MLGYMSAIAKDIANEHYTKLRFLIGDYDVVAYNSIESSAWIKAGQGKASYVLEDSFITENVEVYRRNSVVTMRNTIGSDIEKDTFNLQTLDYSSGLMDMYRGCVKNDIIFFCNSNSEIKKTNINGDSFCFKLIYKQLSLIQNELVVGYSKDNGKTWVPYIKNIYSRK
jgi:hypothetical protein